MKLGLAVECGSPAAALRNYYRLHRRFSGSAAPAIVGRPLLFA